MASCSQKMTLPGPFLPAIRKPFRRAAWRLVLGMRASTGRNRSLSLNKPGPKILAVKFDEIYYFADPA